MKRQHLHNPLITLEKQKQKLLVEKYPPVNSKQLRWRTTLQCVCGVRLKTRNNIKGKYPLSTPKGKKLKTE